MSAAHIGREGFVAAFGLRDAQAQARADDLAARVAADDIEVVRLSFADQHGVLRGKSVMSAAFADVLANGCGITTTLLLKDTSHRTVYPVWRAGAGLGMAQMAGAADAIMVPDPATFKILPWAPRTAWMLCDLYFQDGQPVPFSTRALGHAMVARLADAGFDYLSGLEIECHVFKLDDPRLALGDATQPGPAPEVSLMAQGFQYLTETRLDELEPVMALLRTQLVALDLPLRTLEVEFGPSQIELTFSPQGGMHTADTAVLVRSAVKQLCRRHGLHATFMCRPHGENLFSSGWHLHQSLWLKADASNAFMATQDGQLLSPIGQHAVAGLLRHAAGACVLTTPTINGYKRYRPHSLAPDRVAWGRDNRGAMLRAVGVPGDAGTRIENRAGDPAANPYLYLGGQIACMLLGIERGEAPPAPVDTPYNTDAPALPATLGEAVDALEADSHLRAVIGEFMADYLATLKRAELARFQAAVTDWEQREYFSLF